MKQPTLCIGRGEVPAPPISVFAYVFLVTAGLVTAGSGTTAPYALDQISRGASGKAGEI
jgi:hypothetical protein